MEPKYVDAGMEAYEKAIKMEPIHTRHFKEKKELQARLKEKRQTATKRTKGAINEECSQLNEELYDRQKKELAAVPDEMILSTDEMPIPPEEAAVSTSDVIDKISQLEIQEQQDPSQNESDDPVRLPMSSRPRKPNRQKARLARRAAEQEAQAEQASKEAAQLPDLRQQELSKMQALFKVHNLREESIRPDGHCLYSAVALLLTEHDSTKGKQISYQEIRASTADFITSHSDDFEAFLEEPIDLYTSKIKDTAEWGGQLELQAIARFYGVPIHVLQADGSVEKILPEKTEATPIWLAYYRHSFGLGEHYNALRAVP